MSRADEDAEELPGLIARVGLLLWVPRSLGKLSTLEFFGAAFSISHDVRNSPCPLRQRLVGDNRARLRAARKDIG